MKKRFILLIVLLCLGPAWWLGAALTDHFAEPWIRISATLITLLLVLIWYVFLGPGRVRSRLLIFGGILALLVGSGAFLARSLEYVGSVDGSSLPKFAWKDSAKGTSSSEIATPEKTVTSQLSDRPLPGLAASPRFLFPDGLGQRASATPAAAFDTWTDSPPEEMWRIPMGTGWSGFAIDGQRAITLEQLGESETVTCYDLATGALLWKTGVDARYYSDAPNQMTQMAGDGPRSTPTIVGNRVFTHGATGVLLCLDLSSGELLWQASSIPSLKNLPEWGKSSSVLHLPEENLVVTTGPERDGPSLIAFDAETGAPAWEFTETVPEGLESENFGGSYSTPRLVTLLGRRQILSVNASSISGNDPASGEMLWRYIWPGTFPKVSQPHIVSDDGTTARIFATASYGAGSPLIEVTADGAVSEVWKSTRLKTKFSSAIIRDGFAYGLDEAKPACIDLATGDKVWKARADYKYGQNLLVGEHVLVQAESGHIGVFRADPAAFTEVARIDNALTSLTWNVPTLAGCYLVIRNAEEAICYRLPFSQH